MHQKMSYNEMVELITIVQCIMTGLRLAETKNMFALIMRVVYNLVIGK